MLKKISFLPPTNLYSGSPAVCRDTASHNKKADSSWVAVISKAQAEKQQFSVLPRSSGTLFLAPWLRIQMVTPYGCDTFNCKLGGASTWEREDTGSAQDAEFVW